MDGGERPAPAAQRGIRATIAGNLSAFGYSLIATCSFGALSGARGSPDTADLIFFALGGVASFVLSEMLLSSFFQRPLEEREPERVIAVGTALSFVSVAAAIAVAALAAHLIHAAAAWPIAAFLATQTYLLVSGLEISIAERIARRRGDG